MGRPPSVSAVLTVSVLAVVAIFAFREVCKTDRESFQSHPIHGTFQKGNTITLAVNLELAHTTKQIQQGLMYRTELSPNTGMLFMF